MKIIEILFFAVFIKINAFSQTTEKKIGRILYDISSGKGNRTIEMWFSDENYMYTINTTYGASNIANNTRKKFSSIEDSIKYVEKMNYTNSQLNNLPKQYWFGETNSNVVIFSAFDINNDNKGYCVNDTLRNINWELSNDTCTILTFKCQKASCTLNGIQYTAWFTPSIPIKFAPRNFVGLPGLLLKISNSRNTESLNILELEWPIISKFSMTIKPCDKYQLIKKDEFLRIMNEQNKKVRSIIENSKDKERIKE